MRVGIDLCAALIEHISHCKNKNSRQKCLSMRSDDGRQARVKHGVRHGGRRGGGAGKVRERCGKGAGKVRGVSTCKTRIPRCISRPKTGENGRCGKGAGKVQERCGTSSPHRLSTGVPAWAFPSQTIKISGCHEETADIVEFASKSIDICAHADLIIQKWTSPEY